MSEENSTNTAQDIKTVSVDIDALRPAEYNPRQANEEQCKQLEESIKRFGLVDPIIVNCAPERHNIIIGGHFRWRIAKKLMFSTVPVVYVNIADIEREKELNLRLNKNGGAFDADMLASFDSGMLSDVGFSTGDIDKLFGLDADVEPIVHTPMVCAMCGKQMGFIKSGKVQKKKDGTEYLCSAACVAENMAVQHGK